MRTNQDIKKHVGKNQNATRKIAPDAAWKAKKIYR